MCRKWVRRGGGAESKATMVGYLAEDLVFKRSLDWCERIHVFKLVSLSRLLFSMLVEIMSIETYYAKNFKGGLAMSLPLRTAYLEILTSVLFYTRYVLVHQLYIFLITW